MEMKMEADEVVAGEVKLSRKYDVVVAPLRD